MDPAVLCWSMILKCTVLVTSSSASCCLVGAQPLPLASPLLMVYHTEAMRAHFMKSYANLLDGAAAGCSGRLLHEGLMIAATMDLCPCFLHATCGRV